MNTFASAVAQVQQELREQTPATGATANGGAALSTSEHALTDLFFIIGSSRKKCIRNQFLQALQEDQTLALVMLFWARDIRGGAGERATFRNLLKVLEQHRQDLALKLIPLVPEYGRWDDLEAFETEPVQKAVLAFWAKNIQQGNSLAAKWCARKGPWANRMRKALHMDPKTYRTTIVNLTQVVETHMCAKTWDQINYSHVPSLAAARYQKAFNRNDPVRYAEFKAAAVKGEVNINAQALYPYDVLKSLDHGDPTVALAQWQMLPNYLGDQGFILPLVDTSSSMDTSVSKTNAKLTCLNVAVSLGLYLADKQQGPFANMFLNFASQSTIHKLEGNLLQKVNQIRKCHWGGSTNLESAFKEILRVAVMGNVPASEMPRYLLVLSDMGFDPVQQKADQTVFQKAQQLFQRHNYQMPKIIWWNLSHNQAGYGGDHNFPVHAHESDTALISGFSPAIMKSVLAAKKVTAWDVMMSTLNQPRYEPVLHALV